VTVHTTICGCVPRSRRPGRSGSGSAGAGAPGAVLLVGVAGGTPPRTRTPSSKVVRRDLQVAVYHVRGAEAPVPVGGLLVPHPARTPVRRIRGLAVSVKWLTKTWAAPG